MKLAIQFLAWDRHQHMTELNQLKLSNPPLLMTNSNTYINKQLKKPAEIRFHSKELHPITKMNDSKKWLAQQQGQYILVVN
jgi:hypothetical protein